MSPQSTRRRPDAAERTERRQRFCRDLATPGTFVRKVFTSPAGLHSVSAMNQPEIRALSFVSFGGIGSATSLAKFYAMLANGGELDGRDSFRETRSIG